MDMRYDVAVSGEIPTISSGRRLGRGAGMTWSIWPAWLLVSAGSELPFPFSLIWDRCEAVSLLELRISIRGWRNVKQHSFETPSTNCFLCWFRSHSFGNSNSAEAVAMGLLKQFEGMQLPAASELEWLVPEHDAPQKVGV